jgi:hypothetical protein
MRMARLKLFVIVSLSLVLGPSCETGTEADASTTPTDTTGHPVIPLDGRGGGVIAYAHQPGPVSGVHEIYAINADGTGNTRIIGAQIGLNHHDWSPDAKHIAAVGYPDQTTWSIYVFDADGSNLTRLTSTTGVWDSDPCWSPDGTKIVFTRIYRTQGDRNEIWIMNADGSNRRWNGVEGDGAKWSPDGSRFVYSSNRSGNFDIYSSNIDGTDEQELTSTPFDETKPAWSPDGSRIAFTANAGGDYEVYVMNADGTDPLQLTDNNVGDYVPKWSPDGSLIAFDSGLPGDNHWEVYVMNADGTNLIRVTNTPAPATAINPVWRPRFLGQERPQQTAIPFAPEVLSTEYLVHSSLNFSPQSDELYWSALLDGGPEETLLFSAFDGVTLGWPERMLSLTGLNDHGPAVSHDGDKIFFGSFKPFPNEDSDSVFGVWYVERVGQSWSMPQAVTATLDTVRSVGQVSVASSGNLYFAGRSLGETEPKLYWSELVNGEYVASEQLVGPVNRADAMDPYVDPEERFILFASSEIGNSYGIIDLYISRRMGDGSWGEPVNLGEQVNSEHFERFPSMSRDMNYVFFVRAIGDQYPSENTDFYWISSDVLQALPD